MSFLFDTNIVSETRKRRPAAEWTRWAAAHPGPIFLSVLTIGEIQKGIAKLGSSGQTEMLARWLEELVSVTFAGRILPVDEQVARVWGEICGRSQRDGYSLPAIDSLLAATAVVHDLTVITRNSRDFLRCGARVENPWGDVEPER